MLIWSLLKTNLNVFANIAAGSYCLTRFGHIKRGSMARKISRSTNDRRDGQETESRAKACLEKAIAFPCTVHERVICSWCVFGYVDDSLSLLTWGTSFFIPNDGVGLLSVPFNLC